MTQTRLVPKGRIDPRFSEAGAPATRWRDTEAMLDKSEVYFVTTVREEGKPHVTPLLAVWRQGAIYFCTGPGEQKAKTFEPTRAASSPPGPTATRPVAST